MNREEIKNFLPHREPMLLVDEVTRDGDTAYGRYHVRGDEYFVQGHFPGNPVVPGVILCEILGQCSSTLMLDELHGRTPMYAGLDKVRFKTPVKPGDDFMVTAKMMAHRGMTFFVDAEGKVNGKLCVKASMIFSLVDNQ